MVDRQHWKGLIVQEVPGKGRGVFTKRSFKEGEVACDYHGRQISRKEGMKIHASTADMRPGYMFFYRKKKRAFALMLAKKVASVTPSP